jgi:hypothetical protein
MFSVFAVEVTSRISSFSESKTSVDPFTLNNDYTSHGILLNPCDFNSSLNVVRFKYIYISDEML